MPKADLQQRTTVDGRQRLRCHVSGLVQGVGFRPFVYRLAQQYRLSGWVKNDGRGVCLEIEGQADALSDFLEALKTQPPPPAQVTDVNTRVQGVCGVRGFHILQSEATDDKSAEILPDLAPCADCLAELFDPNNRRYRYPFINCTHCGPRFSIIEGIPYDRAKTSMKQFEMCRNCAAEYHDPENRRFHAQPNACPLCGPQLVFWDENGQVQAEKEAALILTVEALRNGKIIVVKGAGGFHLMVDARNENAVLRLRQKKQRPAKPFALMYSALEEIRQDGLLSKAEATLLSGPAAPIVLLRRRGDMRSQIASAVAPENPDLGVMLPASPLHHLLMDLLGFPIVATSGNRSNEPICTDEHEALHRLKGIADAFLIHDRPIVRPLEDSIVRIMSDTSVVLRRGRGLPLLSLPVPKSPPLIALGGQLKNSVAISDGQRIRLSPHIGDLESPQAVSVFERCISDLQNVYDIDAQHLVCDMHPNYFTTGKAQENGRPFTQVQHHHAHVAACMAEHGLTGEVFGVAWDGTGFGTDGSLWGGEFLIASTTSFERFAHLRPFSLPGGTTAIREPKRAALGLLYALAGDRCFEMSHLPPHANFSETALKVIKTMLLNGLNTPQTSSMGRLFDAVASLLDLRQEASFEGEAAMALEFAARDEVASKSYSFAFQGQSPIIVDWGPMVHAILQDIAQSVCIKQIAARFHATLAEMIVALTLRAKASGVILSGGCFQNRILLERAVDRLEKTSFEVYWPQQVPPNDGGLAVGQAFVAAHQLRAE